MPDPVTGVSAGASLLGGYLSSSGQQKAAETGATSSREAALIQAAAAEQALRLQKQLADERKSPRSSREKLILILEEK